MWFARTRSSQCKLSSHRSSKMLFLPFWFLGRLPHLFHWFSYLERRIHRCCTFGNHPRPSSRPPWAWSTCYVRRSRSNSVWTHDEGRTHTVSGWCHLSPSSRTHGSRSLSAVDSPRLRQCTHRLVPSWTTTSLLPLDPRASYLYQAHWDWPDPSLSYIARTGFLMALSLYLAASIWPQTGHLCPLS